MENCLCEIIHVLSIQLVHPCATMHSISLILKTSSTSGATSGTSGATSGTSGATSGTSGATSGTSGATSGTSGVVSCPDPTLSISRGKGSGDH